MTDVKTGPESCYAAKLDLTQYCSVTVLIAYLISPNIMILLT